MGTEALGAVLPLKLRGGYHSENLPRCRILFSSLIAFAEPGLLKEIHVVTPPDDCADARRLCAEWPSLPLRVFDERDYLPVLRRSWFARGMYIQQLIKLMAASRLDTPFFLTLDPDVILCKPLRKLDLFVDGRALLDPEPRRARPEWWTGSAGVLGMPVDLQMDGMMLTPALLSRIVCQRLFQHLEQRHAGDWDASLLRLTSRDWTEYALYHLMAEHTGLLAQVHAVAGGGTPKRLMCPTAVWAKFQFDRWNLPECFDRETPGFFTLVQSNTRIPPDAVCERLAGYLEIRSREKNGAPSRI